MRATAIASLALAAFAAGCSSFDAAVKSTFVNDANEYITAEVLPCEQDERHVTYVTGPNGDEIPFRAGYKARVTTHDGSRFVAYQVLSSIPGGITYRSDNEKWLFWLRAPDCRLYRLDREAEEYDLVFEGVLCAQRVPKDAKKQRYKQGDRVYSSPRERGDTYRADKKASGK